MFQLEKGTMEAALIDLQNLGLDLNEYKKTNSETISIEHYESLLDFTINTLRQVDTYQKEMLDLFAHVKR